VKETAMSNMKVVAMINEQARREQAEIAAVTKDLYAALAAVTDPLKSEIAELRESIATLRADHDRLQSSLTGDGR
jgi:chromosome condensin MukBEF complex kleisin-like MukF subunit